MATMTINTEAAKVFTITSMKQVEEAMNRAAQKAEEKDCMFINFTVIKHGTYSVEGTEKTYQVDFWKNSVTNESCCCCTCPATVICYHIGATIGYHINQAKKLQVKKVANTITTTATYTAPVTDANSEVGLKAKANAERIMQEIKGEATFTFTATEVTTCMWCGASGVEVDGFYCCKECCYKAYITRLNLDIKPTNHSFDKYKQVNGKIKLGQATKAYANGGTLD